ncbi:MAG TPA: TonB-dependent receptor, partial [Porticoccaceae bacterium]|nr:TonB-dependent receptor [Porticoccaceae bacterium]
MKDLRQGRVDRRLRAALGASLIALGSTSALAETGKTAGILFDEVLVTATKKEGGISVQDAPLAVTAFDEAQIDALHMREIKDLGFATPNVQLDEVGTSRATANFSIRGLGINSSIPSIDPTVGVFVDGMYYGLVNGIVLDTFDLAGVEVLRGPQGLLFGRNVTGGAVLMRTTLPGDEFHMKSKFSVESGLNYTASTVISGPVTDRLGAKLAVYYNDDRGYFENDFDGNDDFGDADTRMVRTAFTYAVNDTLDLILRYEYGQSHGDGPAAKNTGLFPEENFNFAVDEEGRYNYRWDNVILEANMDVAFGDGQIVNIL